MCSIRLFQCKFESERGGGDGGLRLSKMVYVWQNAHIYKNREEEEEQKIITIKNLGSILWHLKLKDIIWVSQGQSTWLVVFQGNCFFFFGILPLK
jgi:hypothetical protein